LCRNDGARSTCKLTRLYGWQGLKRIEIDGAAAGDIVAVAGVEDISIGDPLPAAQQPGPPPPIPIDEPTLLMTVGVNMSPWAGREGSRVTSRQIRDRLELERHRNVSVRVEDTEATDTFKVVGRGELQLSVLIETMRREGYELQVSKPNVIVRKHD